MCRGFNSMGGYYTKGGILIFHQGSELVMLYYKAVVMLYNICMQAVLFTRKRFRLKIETFLYGCAFRSYENSENATTKTHENFPVRKRSPEWKLSKS